MLLVVEDGTGVVGANSYVSMDYADNYFSNHPYHSDSWSGISNYDQQERLLSAASLLVDHLVDWCGYRKFKEQVLDWPRIRVPAVGLYGFLDDSVIPDKLKKAVCEIAIHMSKGDTFAPSDTEGLESVRLDVIELKFSSSVKRAPVPAAALLLLNGLGEYVYGRGYRKVIVG